jgi:hypothetical protein
MAGIVEGLRGRAMPPRKTGSVFGGASLDTGAKNDDEKYVIFASRYKQHRLQLVKTDPMIVNGTTVPATSISVQFQDYTLKLPKDDARVELVKKHPAFNVEVWFKKDRDAAVEEATAQQFVEQFEELPAGVQAVLKQKLGKKGFDLKLPHQEKAEAES